MTLCDHRRYSTVVPEDEDSRADITERKRKWVGEQLQVLEELHLVRRTERADGRRPELLVLSDLGDGEPFDDPGEKATISGNSYVTILGSVIASEAFPAWGAPELAAYVCCMVADRYEEHRVERHAG